MLVPSTVSAAKVVTPALVIVISPETATLVKSVPSDTKIWPATDADKLSANSANLGAVTALACMEFVLISALKVVPVILIPVPAVIPKLVKALAFCVVVRFWLFTSILSLLPKAVVTVVLKLASSPRAAANSFKVSSAVGLESIKLEISVSTKSLTAAFVGTLYLNH